MPEDVYYAHESVEHLLCVNLDEAVMYFMESMWCPQGYDFREWLAEGIESGVTKPVETFCKFVRMKASIDKGWVLGEVLTMLDEDFCFAAEVASEPTPGMEEAERVFIEAILSEYVPYDCQPVENYQIDLMQWLAEHPEFAPTEKLPHLG